MSDIDTMPLDTIKKLEQETESSLRKLRERRESIENDARERRLEHIKPLVIRAHDLLCSWNHTDGCGWGYEMDKQEHNWKGWAHARWLRHYEELLLGTNSRSSFKCTPEQLSKMLDVVEQLRHLNPDALHLIRNGMVAP